MANVKHRRSENAPGDFYVDESCIDCATCRWMAPEVFNAQGGMSAVYHQPTDDAQRAAALRAVVACPTASIGVTEPGSRALLKDAVAQFPHELEDGVHHCGFHSENSYGAASYFIRREGGNVLVDSPRFAAPLVKRIEALGGIRWMFLTHRDDVADHEKWAAKFGCERIIMAADARGMNAETKLKGDDDYEIAPGLTVIPTPGHTRGSACLHYADRFLFTGDHMAWSQRLGHLYAFRSACWYDWDEVVKSLHRLADLTFEWVLPGHGWPLHASRVEAARQLKSCLEWAKTA
ncbi:MAG: MBL fold metallo-hydrolase [Planctomycetes bacterium]|nr:MBL fold metallo-hydrolase [Planctomycetota bacterium]